MPTDYTDYSVAWIVVLTLIQLSGLAASIISMRRTPPVAEEMYRDFATREELRQLRTEFLKTSGEIFDVMRTIKNDLQTTSVHFASQVSRLEGILSRCPGPSACVKEAQRVSG